MSKQSDRADARIHAIQRRACTAAGFFLPPYVAFHVVLAVEFLSGWPTIELIFVLGAGAGFCWAVLGTVYAWIRQAVIKCPACGERFFLTAKNLPWVGVTSYSRPACHACGYEPAQPAWVAESRPAREPWGQRLFGSVMFFRLPAVLAGVIPVLIVYVGATVFGMAEIPQPGDPNRYVVLLVVWGCFGIFLLSIQIGGRFVCRQCRHPLFARYRWTLFLRMVDGVDFFSRDRCANCGLFVDETPIADPADAELPQQ